MSFLALKPCKFNNEIYPVGSTIPEQVVEPGMVKVLVSAGRIVSVDTSSSSKKKKTVK